MALSLLALLKPVTEQEALDLALSILSSLGFNVTSWHDGSAQRHIVQLIARLHSSLTTTVEQIARGGYNGLATGQWLTLLSESHFENVRTGAVVTRGTIRLTSTSTAPPQTISIGQLQISDTATQTAATHTYRNTTGGTLNPGSTLDLTFEAEVAGAASNIPNNTTLYMWTPLVGVTATNPPVGSTGTWISQTGVDEESDAKLTARNESKWATLSYAATDGSYKNWALQALTSVTRVKVRSNNPFGPGTVDVICAKTSGGITSPYTVVGTEAYTIWRYIEGLTDGVGRRPLNDVVSVNSATVKNLSITGTVTVSSAYQNETTSTAIQAAVDAYFNSLAIGGTIIPPASTGVAVFSEIVEAISRLNGVINVALTSPTANVSLLESEIVAGTNYSGLVVNYV